MNYLYHEIGGFKDDNLKLTFIASLPQLIQPEVQRMCGTDIANLKLGEIWQFTLTAVDRMCEQQRLFKKIAKGDTLLKSACSHPFQTKCKDTSCECHPRQSILNIPNIRSPCSSPAIALLHQLKVSCPDYDSDHDLESLFSEEDLASLATLFALPYSDSDSDSDTDSDDMAPVLTIGPPITIKQEPPDFDCPESPDFISCP
ncbi:hypothetical protein JCGZ_19549 [Jatropha curcas]|uniref:Uncharacterized protein n=1 Tax=Jatropha curcas TaxID=180498 RepID=A0A067JYE8_JATCU|nr:hypothetical protein JCGZ_19549 [Jatropha curcas]